ncbi:hypothetical protein ACOZ38_19180 [Sphaerisporangium viridialbum]|uniref:hypothetical protein n=1 Tax=Sphaerisporangium viridialbum TaxID=46189 RepID=UPI003C71FDA4
MVRVGQARRVAARWVAEHAAAAPGFAGAFLSGSAIWLPAQAELPATSDVDVMVVTSGERAPVKLGKFLREGVVVEVTYLPWDRIRSAEVVLGSYHLAGSFRGDSGDGGDSGGVVVADPTGRLARLRAQVSAEYARRAWVRRRCDDAERRIVAGIGSVEASAPLHDQVIGWVFPAGVTTHVLLSAGLRNPTVRSRYVAVRGLLAEYGLLEVHERLLELLGCAEMTPARAAHHLEAMARVFDATVPMARTPLSFSSDITAAARPIAVDGGRELIEAGLHREAVFWVVVTYARCLKIMAGDAPAAVEVFSPGFLRLLGDLGVGSPRDLRERGREVLGFLPSLREVAGAVMAANPGIRD